MTRLPATVLARLQAAPHRFDAFQALRLLELGGARLGTEARPEAEPARLASEGSLAFAPAPVRRVGTGVAARVGIAFLGLTGPLGVLPQLYSEVVQAAGRQRNRAMAAFLDLFNHRLASLFLRASEKYRLPVLVQRRAVERQRAPAATRPDAPDPVTAALFALTGYGTPHLRERLGVPEEVLLYYAGLFAMRNRPASGLGAMLGDYLGVPVAVEQFSGRWLPLDATEQTRLPRTGQGAAFCRLGVDTVAGSRVWDVQGHIRIVVGPLDGAQLLALAPDSPGLRSLIGLVRAYAGPGIGFDIQMILKRDCVPNLRFDPALGPAAPRLGWNSWAQSLPALEDKRDILIDPDHLARTRPAPTTPNPGAATLELT